MKIKLKEVDIGTKRRKTRFLFIPKIINNELRWLEIATYEQKFMEATYVDYEEGDRWINTRWLN